MTKTMTKAERRAQAQAKANKKAPVPAPVDPAPAPAVDPAPAPAVDPAPVDPAPATVEVDPVIDAPEEKEIENTLSYKEIVYAAYNAAYDDLEALEKAYNETANVYIKNEFARAYNEKLELVKELEAELRNI